jgi:large subunit ribosomal protein L23
MALIDILKGRKREEVRPKRPPKGALKRVEKPAKKRLEISVQGGSAYGGKAPAKNIAKNHEPLKQQSKTAQSNLAAELLLRPHITEQSNLLSKKNIYTFRVNHRANKILIKKAFKEMYGFKPIKIRIINVPAKKRTVRGKKGVKSGYKKALVHLKESDKIEFI